jgi:hypothetical protein
MGNNSKHAVYIHCRMAPTSKLNANDWLSIVLGLIGLIAVYFKWVAVSRATLVIMFALSFM